MTSKKDNKINSLINELQGTNGIIEKFNIIVKKFESKPFASYSITELDDYFNQFHVKLDEISNYYEAFISQHINSDSLLEKEQIKVFLDYCSLFINRIQNKYSNPISYRINQINTYKSLRLGRNSLYIGIFSVFLAVVFTFIPYLFSNDHYEKSINKINSVLRNDSIHFNVIDNMNKMVNNQYDNILWKLDSIMEIGLKHDVHTNSKTVKK